MKNQHYINLSVILRRLYRKNVFTFAKFYTSHGTITVQLLYFLLKNYNEKFFLKLYQ